MSSGERLDTAVEAGAVIGHTILGLHIALTKRMKAMAAGFSFEMKSGTRAPTVRDGWLPPKDPGVEDFPFIIVRPSQGEDSQQGGDQVGAATMKIIVGTFADDDIGWFDIMLVIDAIRDDLGEEPVLEGTAYEHWGPLGWEIPEQQPRPQWFGVVTTQWNVPRPRRVEARDPEEG